MKKETKSEKSMFLKMSVIKKVLLFIVFALIASFALSFNIAKAQQNNIAMIERQKIMVEPKIEISLAHEETRKELIEEVDNYITSISRGKHNEMLAEYLVNNSFEHDIDLCFMICQTQIETAFGTAGIGRASSKKSLFGVMKRRYSDYDEAIDDYCRLLRRHYLVNGKTEADLLRRYVTRGGARYAQSLTYELELSRAYKHICSSTQIVKLVERYNKEYAEYISRCKLEIDVEKDSTDRG